MRYIFKKAPLSVLFLYPLVTLAACNSNQAVQSTNKDAIASAGILTHQADLPIDVLKKYHKALVAGDSSKARSLATGTALAIIEYRFFNTKEDDDLRFTYGPANIVRDTCYIPLQIKNPNDRDRVSEGKAVLVKVDGDWKVDRIAMNKQ